MGVPKFDLLLESKKGELTVPLNLVPNTNQKVRELTKASTVNYLFYPTWDQSL